MKKLVIWCIVAVVAGSSHLASVGAAPKGGGDACTPTSNVKSGGSAGSGNENAGASGSNTCPAASDNNTVQPHPTAPRPPVIVVGVTACAYQGASPKNPVTANVWPELQTEDNGVVNGDIWERPILIYLGGTDQVVGTDTGTLEIPDYILRGRGGEEQIQEYRDTVGKWGDSSASVVDPNSGMTLTVQVTSPPKWEYSDPKTKSDPLICKNATTSPDLTHQTIFGYTYEKLDEAVQSSCNVGVPSSCVGYSAVQQQVQKDSASATGSLGKLQTSPQMPSGQEATFLVNLPTYACLHNAHPLTTETWWWKFVDAPDSTGRSVVLLYTFTITAQPPRINWGDGASSVIYPCGAPEPIAAHTYEKVSTGISMKVSQTWTASLTVQWYNPSLEGPSPLPLSRDERGSTASYTSGPYLVDQLEGVPAEPSP